MQQSNLSIVYGDQVILKIYRRLRDGVQPDVEIARFLTDTAQFQHTPAFLGLAQHVSTEGSETTLAAAFAFAANQGDAWEAVTSGLQRDVEENDLAVARSDGDTAPAKDTHDFPLNIGSLLGKRTAELHLALATPTDDPAFSVEAVTPDDLKAWSQEASEDISTMLERLESALATLPEGAGKAATNLLSVRAELFQRLEAASSVKPSGGRSRIHGDFHLGQVLVAQNDLLIIDFEGEPRRPLEQRRRKTSPLRDVAGMLRSLDYAAAAALEKYRGGATAASEAAARRVAGWRDLAIREFLASYREHIAGGPTYPDDPEAARRLLDLFLLQKASYEIAYELAHRPDWVGIPLRGIFDLLNTETP